MNLSIKIIKKIAVNLTLVLFSIVLVFIFTEILLRFLRPEYGFAAKSVAIENQSRIFINPKMTVYTALHPDTKKKYMRITNSLGFMQHREFKMEKAPDIIRIGFFGDSYTANERMPAEYSFTEPLDYLLNKTGKKFEVLNFGVDGYGTDQIYIQYLQDGVKLNLDEVFYMYCSNDLRNILENNLIHIGEDEKIVFTTREENGFFTKVVRKLYFTYLLIDFSNRYGYKLGDLFGFYSEGNYIGAGGLQIAKIEELENAPTLLNWRRRFHHPLYMEVESNFSKGIIDKNVSFTLKLFNKILEEFRNIANENGADFHIVTLPSIAEDKMFDYLSGKGFSVFGLYSKFSKYYSNNEYRFKNDYHWNEEGNKLAAVEIFRLIADKYSIDYGGDEFIEQALYEYYSAFNMSAVSDLFVRKHEELTDTKKSEILHKYKELNYLPLSVFKTADDFDQKLIR